MAVVPRIENISPARAKALLARNDHNRVVRANHVRQLTEAMVSGQWVFNGETIKLAEDGSLLDGQHRLMAIREAGVTVPMVIVEGLPNPVQDSVDTGRRRKLSDVLAIQGHPDVHALATALNSLYRYRTAGTFGRTVAPTTPQALDLLEREPGIIESVRVARRVTKEIKGPIGVFAACHHIFSELAPDEADEFFDKLRRGTNLGSQNPIFLLRRQIIKARLDRAYAQKPHHVAGLTFKAFIAWREGKTLRLLSYKSNGPNPERFPRLNGTSTDADR
jgi:hypothetical protein